MNNFLRLYKVEQKLFFRSADVFIFNLCMPLGIGIRLMKVASVGMPLGTMGSEIVILAVIAVICIWISVKTFRWE